MPTKNLRDDISYILLKKIGETVGSEANEKINITPAEFDKAELTQESLQEHLEYLTVNEYVNADVTSGEQNYLTLNQAELTEKGKYLLKKLGSKYDAAGQSKAVSIDAKGYSSWASKYDNPRHGLPMTHSP